VFFSSEKRSRVKYGLFAVLAVAAMALLPSTATAAKAKKRASVSCAPAKTTLGGGTSPTAVASKARSGGISLTKSKTRLASTETTPAPEDCAPPGKAILVNGRAIAPPDAPPRVKRVIAWANKIRKKPYIYGGGHRRFFDRGYDCSGAVSFALRGGRFVSSPMPSTGYFRWGAPGEGRWITVYTHAGHAYMVVAGLRFDTSMTGGNGPRWSEVMRSSAGFRARHPVGF
jgi:cell wall-associated NlpC family hydrolase